MPTITAGDFRNGVTFEKDGSVCTVVEFQHVKPGKMCIRDRVCIMLMLKP